uniref:Lysophospholipid acyltransferase n=1 Tax=Parastrongyloides trichosuri TaxID=131310 RepID=A0A0N5A2T0_PARTI
MEETFFDGCKVFTPLANILGVDVNSANFVLTICFSIGLGKIFSKYLGVKEVGVDVRSFYILIWGIILCYFMYGRGIIHPLVMALSNYFIMCYASKDMISTLCFILPLTHLLIIHLLRFYYVSSYTMDITSVLMMMVQKCCLIGFAYSDGILCHVDNRKKSNLKSIEEIPKIHIYLSYMFNFQSLLTGPSFEFGEFKKYLEGTNYKERKDKKSNVEEIIKSKLIQGFAFLAVYLIFKNYTCDKVLEPHIYSLPFFKWLFVCQIGIIALHCRYFFAWYLADAICNISGFGFNGYDDKGEEKWDLCTNVDPMKVEFSLSLKETIDNWNIGTCKWLRITVYDRLPGSSGTYATFILSAIWHGFNPGYYVTFTIASLFISASRTFRRYFRPLCIKTKETKIIYDIFTFTVTRLAIIYGAIPFTVETLYNSYTYLKEFYFAGHIIALLIIYLLPLVGSSLKKSTSLKINESPTQE